MKKNLLFLLILTFNNQFFAAAGKPMFSVFCWNILGPNVHDVENFGFKKGDYSRLEKTIEIIKESRASILCLQEVDLEALEILKDNLISNKP